MDHEPRDSICNVKKAYKQVCSSVPARVPEPRQEEDKNSGHSDLDLTFWQKSEY
jgi:hypothetical protein